MNLIALLIIIPTVAALTLFFVKSDKLHANLVRIGSIIIICLSVFFVGKFFQKYELVEMPSSFGLELLIAVLEVAMAAYIISCGVKAKRYFVASMALVQVVTILIFEFAYAHKISAFNAVLVDPLALIMVLIIGIVGSFICIFAVSYMRDYHNHHKDIKDRRGMFYAVLFAFLSAMFGLVLYDTMTYVLFFWEVTSLCSFILIGYSRTKEATDNAFLALTVNVFGGLLFTVGVVILGVNYGINSLFALTLFSSTGAGIFIMLPVFFMAVAALTKSAQMPFSRWLLGAMVAPTPTSAMLHSSTMVKAGVYLIIRISPLLGANLVGMTVTAIGALTFLVTAAMAISQSDAKRILAYSTISNLGLIVACASINTPESIWAAVMLIVFHAVAKSLLFLTVGSTEHQVGNRNVEGMDGLYNVSAKLALLLSIGIAGMFIAPFGMLISKWAAIKAFLDYGSILILMMLAFGSTITFFFWTKWLGKLVANTHIIKPEEYKMSLDEKSSLYSLAALVIGVCAMFPLLSKYFVVPFVDVLMLPNAFAAMSGVYLNNISYYGLAKSPLSGLDVTSVLTMLFILIITGMLLIPLFKKFKAKEGLVYMAGENTGDNTAYLGGMKHVTHVQSKNWYMEDYFGERLWFGKSQLISAVILFIGFVAVVGGYNIWFL